MDIYSIGHEVGQIAMRVGRIERTLKGWRRTGRRVLILLLLWTALLIGGTNTDTMSELVAKIIKKTLIGS